MASYIVSARKYRPATFDSVVGQEALTTTLRNAIASGKLAHAYLFCGPRGVGKTTCARIFAKTINCLSPTEKGEACDHCESCKAFNEQRSYNIHELDAASNNSVDDIRGLIEQVMIPPQIGRYKVFIIDEVHMLSSAAFNAFLKTLEEPPAHAVFVLATTEKHKILPTILSRCQIFDFARMTIAGTVAHLRYVAEQEGYTFEDEALHVIAEKADGGMRDALSIFDRVAGYCEGRITYQKVVEDLNVLDYDEYFTMTDALIGVDVPKVMVSLNGILSRGFEGNYFIAGLSAHLRNLLMARDESTLPLLEVSERVRSRYREQAQRADVRWLYRALRLCNDCDLNYRAASNKRLLVELTLIELAQAASGEEEPGCGRRPIRRLLPLFSQRAAVVPAAPAPRPARPVEASSSSVSAPGSTVPPVSRTVHEPSSATYRPARPGALSIKSLQARYRQGRDQTPTPAEAAPQTNHVAEPTPSPLANDSRRATPIKGDDLLYYWHRFAQQLPREHSAIAGRMKAMRPELAEDYGIEVTVDNEIVEQYMKQIQVSLVNYLRTHLRNDYLTMRVRIAESDEPTRAVSRAEQFAKMLESSKSLRILHERLALELA